MPFALDFKAKKRKRNTRTCTKGYNCGNSCIQRALKCRRKFSDQASTYAGWLKKQGEKATPKPKQKKKATPVKAVAPKKATKDIKPLTDTERSQPEKLIEVGRAFVAKFIKPGQVEQEINAYEQKKEDYLARETARLNAAIARKGELFTQINKLDSLAIAAKKNGDTEKAKELKSQADKAHAEFKISEKETAAIKIKPFDKIAELSTEHMNTLMDFDMSEADRDRKKRRLEQEIEKEQDKLPHNRTLAKLKEGIKKNSPLTPDQAKSIYSEQSDVFDGEEVTKHSEKIASDFTNVIQMTGDPPKKLFIRKKTDRAHAENLGRSGWMSSQDTKPPEFDNTGVLINIGNSYERNQSVRSAKTTMFHEYAHSSEFRHQEIAAANQKWIKNRATSDTPQKLRDITSSKSYEDSEVAYPDKFVSPYVGKDYTPRGGGQEMYKATEVLSVGMEYFTTPNKMAELFTKDPEHFYLTIGSIIEIQNKNRK